MARESWKFRGTVWIYSPDAGSWYFTSLPKLLSQEIREQYGRETSAWGSLRVSVTLGTSTWRTSLFPDKTSGTYLLPLKADIRKREGIREGSTVDVCLVRA